VSTVLLLDTNVVSEAARPSPDPGVLARLGQSADTAAVSAVTWHELRFGVDRLPPGQRRSALDAFVRDLADRFPVLPYDRAAASWHAAERARLERLGVHPPFADGQIAATAAVRGLRLVTRNVADFTAFTGLTVESWWGSSGRTSGRPSPPSPR
jgi:tRNA(fMet)-specific endonuclease VapC